MSTLLQSCIKKLDRLLDYPIDIKVTGNIALLKVVETKIYYIINAFLKNAFTHSQAFIPSHY